MNFDYTLYLVTDSTLCPREELPAVVEQAVSGGVTMVQLREKDCSSRVFYETALRVQEVTRRHGVPLLINDRLDIALAVDADGLHIGQSDLPAAVARRILGAGKLLGVSAGTVEEARQAVADGADYLGVGAIFPTDTKEDADAVGIEGLKQIRAVVDVPIVGIGGLKENNLPLLKGAGMDGIAVVSAIVGQQDPRGAAQQLCRALEGVLRT